MNISAVWTRELPGQMSAEDSDSIDGLLELLDFLDDNQLDNFLDKDAVFEEKAFCEWIYSKEDPGLNDRKRELLKKITRYKHRDHEQLCALLDRMGSGADETNVGIDFREEIPLYASTMKKFYKISRVYLVMENERDFAKDLSFCYPNIYFDPSVPKSLHTLNRKFVDAREEIAEHLTALDEYKDKFIELSENHKGYRECAAEFKRDSGIDCSPQNDRRDVVPLKRDFYNEITKQMEPVKCELHTKFKKYNIDITRQDRIYFAPPRRGILSGKVIVVHIGDHL